MPITKRTLEKWRKEALEDSLSPKALINPDEGVDEDFHTDEVKELSNRILRLTQELLDQHLIRGKS